MRPWGLAVPILVLVVCLPLLRPLRSTDISDNELERLATIQSLVERKSLSINERSFRAAGATGGLTRGTGPQGEVQYYSKQPPALAALLAGPYWVMSRLGLTFDSNLTLTSYLLTLLGSTLPVALAAGLVYRMARLFELFRPWRMLLATAAVFGSGLVSYATVLNSHAPAAALILGACGAIFHAATTRRRGHAHGWLTMAGLSASLAAVIDLGAGVYLLLLMIVVLAFQWAVVSRLAGLAWYILGALPPIVLHAALVIPVTGDLRPGFLHAEMIDGDQNVPVVLYSYIEDPDYDPDQELPGFFSRVALHLADGLLGPRGLLSHFPILLIGIGGIGAVLHRHWPAPVKTLAVASLAGAILIVAAYVTLHADWSQPMFSVRWFIVFLPLIVFWSGAWLRKQHHPGIWSGAAFLLVFSILTTVLGATAPFTKTRPGEHTAYAAARQLLQKATLPSGTMAVRSR